YVAFWGVLPAQPGVSVTRRSTRVVLQGAGLITLAAGVLIAQFLSNGFGLDATVVALIAVIGLGAGIIWHQADPERRKRWTGDLPDAPRVAALRRASGGQPAAATTTGFTLGERGWFLLRLVGGGLLIVIGIIGVLSFLALRGQNAEFGTTITGLLFAL